MSKKYHELRLNDHVLKIEKKRWHNFSTGALRLYFSAFAILCAGVVGLFSARIESGYYPSLLRGAEFGVGNALFVLIVCVLGTVFFFWQVITLCDWSKKTEVKK